MAIWFAPWHVLFYCHQSTKSSEIYLAKRMDREHEAFEKQNNWELAVENWLFLKYFYAWRSSLNSCSIIGAKRRGIDVEIVAVPLKSSNIFFFFLCIVAGPKHVEWTNSAGARREKCACTRDRRRAWVSPIKSMQYASNGTAPHTVWNR